MPGRKTVTIKGQFGSEEFAANYRAAVEGEKSVKRFAGKHGTFNRLASEYLNSATFAELAPDTQRTRRYITERLLAKDMVKEDDLRLPMTAGQFLAKAWKLANEKARELGWIV